ncbi:MAG: 16S rRNA (cytosine(1402)-N(4))-methyltransferase RsmH [bacterium]|nr:16S rRNA (cytosine(1402)-N(4))-methyltransferase RsmH [bacterium]
MIAAPHVPVLRSETLGLLAAGPGRRIVDGTFGFGGHSAGLLEAGADVLGIDLDAVAQDACRQLAADQPRLCCHHGSFRDLDGALRAARWDAADGVLLDLGVSSKQLDDPTKGFSYRTVGPLDLRFDQTRGETAADLLARLDEAELADLLWKWGEERGSRRIARELVRRRAEAPLATTAQLREAVQAALPRGIKPEPVLSRVFQALRIAVNDELGALADALTALRGSLRPGGRLVVISYHSLEDRLVKRFIDHERRDCVCPPDTPICVCHHQAWLRPLTRGALVASAAEQQANARSRSAKLRAAEVIR